MYLKDDFLQEAENDRKVNHFHTSNDSIYEMLLFTRLISSYSRIPLGAAHVEITNEKVSVRSLKAESIADISVTILADQVLLDIYHIIVQKSTIFTRQYQPGRIKLDVEYSSGFSLPLSLINPNDYLLDVVPRDNSLVLLNFDKKQYNGGNQISRNNGDIDDGKHFDGVSEYDLKNSISPASRNAIIPTSAPPTFLVIGETKGNVLYVSLFSSSVCYKNADAALYSTTVYVEATFEKLKAKSSENDGSSPFQTKNPSKGYPAIEPQRIDTSDIYHYAGGGFFNSRRSADVSFRNPSTNNRRFPSKTSDNEAKLTHMEVAIYILVGVFILVAAAFSLHCYAVADKSAVNRRRLSRTLNGRRNIVIGPSAFRYASYLSVKAFSHQRHVIENTPEISKMILFPDWLRWPLNGLVRFVRKNAGVVSSARQEFVWVGPDELNGSLASSCSQRLLNREPTMVTINKASSALSHYDEDYNVRNHEV
uniref:Transmembrane protein family 132 middle domain-containing protein n=1 Tax=Romanomermis culicivorax TaxID=13658 RepID=A0A915J8C5_ROMCU